MPRSKNLGPPIVNLCSIATCLVGILLQGCTYLSDVNASFVVRTPPSYLLVSTNQRLRPGILADFPSKLHEPTLLDDELARCGMVPAISSNGGYRETDLQGTWFSNRIWIWFYAPDIGTYRQFALIDGMANAGHTFAALLIEPLVMDVLDPSITTYTFLASHPNWTVPDYLKHFGACRAPSSTDRYIAHQVLRAIVSVRFHNAIGLPVHRNEQLTTKMKLLGFKPADSSYDYISVEPVAISRTSRLELTSLGFFRQVRPLNNGNIK